MEAKEVKKEEKLEKSVKIRSTVYEVEIKDGKLSASETNYPMPGYSNNYGTEYVVDTTHSKRWAKLEINCWNNTYATRGHGMTDYWIDAVGYVRRKEAEEFIKTVKEELERAENGTPDVLEVFGKVRDFVQEKIGENY